MIAASYDDETLRNMAEHVVYEVEQLREMTQLLASGRYPTVGGTAEQRVVGQALFEAALMHARVLDEFFAGERRKQPDDVIARDYLPTWPTRSVLLKKERERVNKRAAHLTTARLDGSDPWKLSKANVVLEVCGEFFAHLREEQPRKWEWFRHRLRI